MLFLIVATSCSLKYIYLRVCLLMLHLVPLHFFVAAWVFCVIYAARTDVDAVLLLACCIC
jgi:hypothetical protein